VTQFHSRDEARKADNRFAREVQKKELPEDMPERKVRTAIKAADQKKGTVTVSVPALLVETNLVASAGEAKRLIAQGAVEIDGERVTENDWKVTPGAVLKVGKRRFCRVTL
jgi:tyrosyl-tRNA synthetase